MTNLNLTAAAPQFAAIPGVTSVELTTNPDGVAALLVSVASGAWRFVTEDGYVEDVETFRWADYDAKERALQTTMPAFDALFERVRRAAR